MYLASKGIVSSYLGWGVSSMSCTKIDWPCRWDGTYHEMAILWLVVFYSSWPELCIPIGGSCDIKGGSDNALATVFQDTFLLTDHLAIAMQALFAIAYSIAFENTKLFFTQTSDAEMRFFKSHSIPRQYTGFSIVVGILNIHTLLLASIIWRFFGSQSLEGARPVRDPSSSIERTDASDSTNSTTLNEEYIPLQSLLE